MKARAVAIALLVLAGITAPAAANPVVHAAADVEAELGGRVGVVLQQHGEPPAASYRAQERFPMTSTFKALLCGAVLAQVDAGKQDLQSLIPYGPEVLVPYSPVTEKYAGGGMTVGDLCHAAITLSDNTAANLILQSMGGPAGLTSFLRTTGDEVSRLDRWEPALNEALPGDLRDSTTPQAIVDTLDRLLLGNVLSPASRKQLEDWMIADQVADSLIRASLPPHWIIGDKTGSGEQGSRAIVALIRPVQGTPWVVSIYLTGSHADLDARNQGIAKIGKSVVQFIANATEPVPCEQP